MNETCGVVDDFGRLRLGSYRVPLGIAISIAVGYLACQSQELYLLGVIVIVFWSLAKTRTEAVCYVATYTVLSTWVVVPSITEYLHWNYAASAGVWFVGMTVVIVPWLLLYRNDLKFIEIRLFVVLAATLLPPIGLVQFASPFVGSSLLVPGLGYLSIILGIVVIGQVLRAVVMFGSQLPLSVLGVLAAVSLYTVKGKTLDGWAEVNTAVNVGGLEHTIVGSADALNAVRNTVLRDRPKVAVVGESTGGFSVDAGSIILGRASEISVIVAGGRIDNQQALFVWEGNKSSIPYRQRVKPVLFGHMDGEWFGNKSVEIDGKKIAPLICYEGAIPWPMISAMSDRPDAFLAVGNFHWSSNYRYFERVLRSHVGAWGRVFDISTVVAVNRGASYG